MKPPPSHHRSLAPEAQRYDDIERLVELDFVRATEAAARKTGRCATSRRFMISTSKACVCAAAAEIIV